MPRKFYTIFILPHAQERFRKIHISRNFLLGVAAVVGVIALGAFLSPHLLFKSLAQAQVVSELERENQRLRSEKDGYEASLSKIAERMRAMESLAGRLASAVGVDANGAGGPTGTALVPTPPRPGREFDADLEDLRRRAEQLDGTMETIEEAWEVRLRILSSTPTLAPVEGYLSDGFGWRRDPFTGVREFHRGLDIVAPTGTPVMAPADGLVTAAGRMSGYGKTVHLSHGAGLGSRFGHLSEILVKPGQRVRRGDVIGRVGSTGRSTGPHLHYEIFRAGRPVDPRSFLKGKAG
jgi:murein DD-endopeptidase MepM/ murein hydrolase activator NlpD